MITALLCSVFTTVAWILIHLFLMHQTKTSHRLKAMTTAFLSSLPFLYLLLFFFQHQHFFIWQVDGKESFLLSYLYAFLLQLLFFFFFVECFYHIERSVTLRFLIEIDQAPATLITSITEDYSLEEMIERRLNDLHHNRWIFHKNKCWFLSKKAYYLARAMHFSCWLFQSQPQNKRL